MIMKRKFSTMMAVFLTASALSMSASATDPAVPEGYCRLADAAAGTSFLGVAKDKTDSLVYTAASTPGEDVLSDRYFWKVKPIQTPDGARVYVLSNKKTGQALSFGLPSGGEATAWLSSGDTLNTWVWVADAAPTTAAPLYTVLPGGEIYGITLNADFYTPAKTNLLTVKKYADKATAISGSLALVKATTNPTAMTAKQLNNKNGGAGFDLTFTPASNGKPNCFVDNTLQAQVWDDTAGDMKMDATDNTVKDELFLAVVGKKPKNSAGKETQYYVVADTAYFEGLENGVVFSTDTLKLTYADDGKITNIEPAPGRKIESYRFKATYDYAKGALYLNVKGIPAKAADAKTYAATPTLKAVTGAWYVYVAELSDRKEVSVIEAPATVASLDAGNDPDKKVLNTQISFKTGTAVSDLDTKQIYAVQQVKDDGSLGNYYVASGASDCAANASAASALVPATQFVLVYGGDNEYTLYNRENGAVLNDNDKATFKTDEENVYRIGDARYKLTVLKTATGENGKYIGYRHFTTPEVANTAFTLRVESAVAGDDVFLAVKDSSVIVAKTEGQYFTIKPYGETAFGYGKDSLKRTAYMLIEQYGERHLAYDNASKQFVLSKAAYGSTNDTAVVFFQATPVDGQYNLVCADVDKTKGILNNTGLAYASLEYVLANLTTGKAEKVSAAAAVIPTVFVFEDQKNAYENVESSHQVISLASDDASALTHDKDNFAVIKRVNQLKSSEVYNPENFALWVGLSSDEDPTKPLYYIRTQQGLDSAAVEAGHSLFLVNLKDSTDAKYKWLGASRLGFIEGKLIAAEDSLELYKGDIASRDTVATKGKHDTVADWAFAINPNGGLTLQNGNQYMSYVNGVLVMADQINNGIACHVEKATELPTSNESVTVSTVVVSAIDGQIRIANAAGKTVHISNLLGKESYNGVLRADLETVALASGMYIVKVEGEEAVKVILK